MRFEKLDYKIDLRKNSNAAKVDKQKRGSGATFGHFLNAKTDKTKFTSFSRREKLNGDRKSYMCKKAGPIRNECP